MVLTSGGIRIFDNRLISDKALIAAVEPECKKTSSGPETTDYQRPVLRALSRVLASELREEMRARLRSIPCPSRPARLTRFRRARGWTTNFRDRLPTGGHPLTGR